MKENPPVNYLMGEAARLYDKHPEKVHVIHRDKLAERLGVSPKERLTMTIVNDSTLVGVSVLLDGGDLTDSQLVIFKAWLQEEGLINVLGVVPEKPIAS
jgi:hypothetical protein